MRFVGLDIHRDQCEVAIVEYGRVRSAGRFRSSVAEVQRFAEGLGGEDWVGLEATAGADAIARLIEPYVARVVIANTRRLQAISGAKVKTDRRDARTIARLLAGGLLEPVWTPDEASRALRRVLARRAALLRARTRAKNETHAVLTRNLCPPVPVTDLFGRGGRRWLAQLEVPLDERLTIDGCIRQIDFLDAEVAVLDRIVAERALDSADVRRLMSVPGVNVLTAATFMAWIGEVSRFPSARHLVGYVGLDPKTRQSGAAPARHGHISKEGASEVRHVLGEAVWSVVATPGPMRAFYQRLRARRGPQIAATAVARKLIVLFWHMLTRGEDYAYARPSMTQNKLRRLQLTAGATPRKGQKGIAGGKSKQLWDAERELSRQAETAYTRLVDDWQASRPHKAGAGATPGRAFIKPSTGKAARQAESPKHLHFATSVTRTQETVSHEPT
jgi:transposase